MGVYLYAHVLNCPPLPPSMLRRIVYDSEGLHVAGILNCSIATNLVLVIITQMPGGSSFLLFLVLSDLAVFPRLSTMFQDIPVRPCFALMLAFSEPLAMV